MPIKTFDFKIGTDPEFTLTMQGKKVDAKQTMRLMLKNKPNLIPTPDEMGYAVKNFGNIGWDGANSTGEIRPAPSYDPKKVVSNLAQIFKEFTKHIKICDLSTISEFSSIGGHIHLEIPKGEKWNNEKKNTIHRRLASFYLPLLISENKTNLNLRLRQGYGSIKDQRIERHFEYEDGTDGYTFEFRSPSAEWLTTPKIAASTLSYFAVVYHEILKHPKNFLKYNDIVYKSDKQGDALQALAIMEFNLLTDSILSKAKKYIRQFEMYPLYKKEIEYLFNAKQVIKDKQKAEYNIAKGWNLIKQTIPKKNQILSSKKKIQEIAKNSDFDTLKSVLNIHYNEDTNVALFAENLKDRIAAFNWKLKNNYFIFGLRKGIDQIISKNLQSEYISGSELLKTKLDLEYTDRLFNKMNSKFNNSPNMSYQPSLDFTTGKPKNMGESMIIIGLPYELRIKEDIKTFLNFIWSIEKGEITKKQIKPNTLLDDYNNPIEEQGIIYKILTKQIETNQVVIDENSNSLRNHERAISSIIEESNI